MSDIRDRNSTSKSQSQSQSQTQKEESKRADAPAANDDWAWKGKVVRLNQADYAAWKKAYSALDLDGELITRDAFLSDQPREVQARWCQSTSQHFSNRNMKAKAMGEASQQPDSQGRREVGVDWSKYNATGYRIEEF